MMNEQDIWDFRMRAELRDVLRWLVHTACWYGFATGWKYNRQEQIFVKENLTAFGELEYFWYLGHGGSVNIGMRALDSDHAFAKMQQGSSLIADHRVFTMGTDWHLRPVSDLSALFAAIDNEVAVFFEGIHQRNAFRLCESPVHAVIADRLGVSANRFHVCLRVGAQWLCPDCIENLRLMAPPTPEETRGEETTFAQAERAKMTPSLRFFILARDNFTCRACGRNPREHDVVLHVDHILAIANGGTTEPDNLQALCAECNLAKRAKRIYQMELWGA